MIAGNRRTGRLMLSFTALMVSVLMVLAVLVMQEAANAQDDGPEVIAFPCAPTDEQYNDVAVDNQYFQDYCDDVEDLPTGGPSDSAEVVGDDASSGTLAGDSAGDVSSSVIVTGAAADSQSASGSSTTLPDTGGYEMSLFGVAVASGLVVAGLLMRRLLSS